MSHAKALGVIVIPPVMEFVACIVRRLMQVHVYNHTSYCASIPMAFKDALVFLQMIEEDTNTPVRVQHPAIADQTLRLFHEVLKNGFEGEILKKKDTITSSQSITPYMVYIPNAEFALTLMGNPAQRSDLESLLNVPPIPIDFTGYIAYFSTSKKYRKEIMRRFKAGSKSDVWRLTLQKAMSGLSLSTSTWNGNMSLQSRMMMDASILESLYVK